MKLWRNAAGLNSINLRISLLKGQIIVVFNDFNEWAYHIYFLRDGGVGVARVCQGLYPFQSKNTFAQKK